LIDLSQGGFSPTLPHQGMGENGDCLRGHQVCAWKIMKIKDQYNGIKLLTSINALTDFEVGDSEAQKPVLVGCLHKNFEYKEQVEALQTIEQTFGEQLEICLLDVSLIKAFMQKFKIFGTPTFLILLAGKEKGRLLGQIRSEDLREFVLRILPGFQPREQ
jgi:hypothetical protein